MSSNATARALRLVPAALPTINADWIAYTVMEHIDTMFPEMWKALPAMARPSIRTAIVKAVLTEDAKR